MYVEGFGSIVVSGGRHNIEFCLLQYQRHCAIEVHGNQVGSELVGSV